MSVRHGRNAVVTALAKLLKTTDDPQVILEACRLWLEATGKRKPVKKPPETVENTPQPLDPKLAQVLGETV